MHNKIVNLSIVISNFNTSELLKKTLYSLNHYLSNITYEVIVVDDGSIDGSANMIKKFFPKVNLVINNVNQGYSKSYNIGTKKATGKYILHLNSDVIFLGRRKLDYLIKFMEKNPKIGIIGCKILKSDRKLDLPCKRSFPTITNVFWQTVGLSYLFPKNRLFGNYYLTYLDENKIHEVDCLMGAFMLIRKKVFDEIGLIDEQFFIYGEDIDFCLRAKQAGWKIYYNPMITIVHHHGGTTNKWSLKHIIRFHQAMFIYYQKHLFKINSLFVNFIVYLGIILRSIGAFILDLFHKIKSFISNI